MNSIVKNITDLSGYHFPFEGEKHLATCLLVPYREDTWRDNAKPAMKEYLSIVKAIAPFEPVVVIIDPRLPYSVCTPFQMENTHVLRLRYDDAWARDSLPVFLKNETERQLVGIDFGFNAWGGSYDGLYKDYEDDNALGKAFLEEMMIARYPKKDFILEGGSIHTDGEGTLLVTEECLLSTGRNPSLSKEEIEQVLKDTLQVKKVIWLPYGVYNDETDGHVDNICCFLKKGVVALAVSEDENDPQHERDLENLKVLENETDCNGEKLTIVKLPLPKPMFLTKEEEEGIIKNDIAIKREEGRRLAGSYVNFYMGEKFLLLPQFGCESDKVAYDILKDFYKEEKEIIQIPSKEILLGGGNIHCVTKQIPYMERYPFQPEDEDK